MEVSVAESRILKKVIRTWIESEYGSLEKLNYLKQNIDDFTWAFAKRLHSEIGKSVPLDFILETIVETILILYPEYDAKERKRQETEEAARKLKAELEVIEQRKQKEKEVIRQREEEQKRLRREAILKGDIDQIRVIVRDCICEVLEEEPREGIDDESLFDDLRTDEFSFKIDEFSVYDIYTALEIRAAVETAIESVIEIEFKMPDNLVGYSTINHISKAIGFFFVCGRFPDKSEMHNQIIIASKIIDQLDADARDFKMTLGMLQDGGVSGLSTALSKSPLATNIKANSVFIEFMMRYSPPWSSQTLNKKNIEKFINATQVLIDNPQYSDDYGYDTL
jgi:hypothetical protein